MPQGAATRQSVSCSDITGTNSGGPGPANCRTGGALLAAARAARIQNPAAAAETYKKAADAYRRAGDIELANKILQEASTLVASAPNPPPQAQPAAQPPDAAPKLAAPATQTATTAPPVTSPSQSPQAAPGDQANATQLSDANSCPPAIPARYWQDGPHADYCVKASASCWERGAALYGYLCAPDADAKSADANAAGPKAQKGAAATDKAPKRFKGVAPDVQTEILALGESIIDAPDDDPARDELVRRLERRLANHRVRMKPQDLACLQPISGTSRPLQDIPLRWKPEHIKKEAIDQSHLCDGVPEGDAKEACREENYGRAVMWAEPELAGQCRTAEMPNNHDIDAVAECAKQKFLSAWVRNYGIASAPTPDNWILPATCNARTSPAIRKSTLRDILAASLAAADSDQTSDSRSGNNLTATGPTIADKPPSPPPATDENDAYCDYMARSVVRGELTPGPATAIPPECKATIFAALALRARQQVDGVSPFSMDADETDREIAKLLKVPPGTQAGGPLGAQLGRQIGPK